MASLYSVVVGQRPPAGWLPIAKVQYPVLAAADRAQTRIAAAFLRTVQVVQAGVRLGELEEALQGGNLNAVLLLLDLDNAFAAAAKGAGLAPQETSLQEALQATWQAGAQAELEALGRVPVAKASIGLRLAFDLNSPEAIAWLASYTFNLIRETSLETRLAIGEVILEAFKEGGHPYEQAREIRSMIGLTRTQTRAVRNFRKMLQGGPLDLQQALSRELRDHRFDATIRNALRAAAPLPKSKIDEMTRRYYERYLKYRAENIARTETIRASHMGQREAWRQAKVQGLLKGTAKRRWVVTRDDRLCDTCRPIPKMNEGGRELDELFQTPLGPVEGPPLHPSCRCTVTLVVDW